MRHKIKIRYMVGPGHTYMQVFMGLRDGTLGLCGNLTMRSSEFSEFKEAMQTRFNNEEIEFVREDI